MISIKERVIDLQYYLPTKTYAIGLQGGESISIVDVHINYYPPDNDDDEPIMRMHVIIKEDEELFDDKIRYYVIRYENRLPFNLKSGEKILKTIPIKDLGYVVAIVLARIDTVEFDLEEHSSYMKKMVKEFEKVVFC